MIKAFFKKNQAILFTVLATSLVTSLVASGYFVMKNEEKNASQKIEVLQKSIEELQDKSEKETVEGRKRVDSAGGDHSERSGYQK